jgi:hypothetical protein
MPWPISADRLSPSGPFLPLGGGIIKIGGDCVRIFQELEENDVQFLLHDLVTVLQVPIPDYKPGNGLLPMITLGYVWQPGEDDITAVVMLPVLNIAGDLFVVDNTLSTFVVEGTGVDHEGDNLGVLTAHSFFVPPPELMTSDPTIGWLVANSGNGTLTILGENFGPTGGDSPGRTWVTVAELDQRGIIQTCEVDMFPLPAP